MDKLTDSAWKKFDSYNLERDDFELELQPSPNGKFTTAIFTMTMILLNDEFTLEIEKAMAEE